MLWRTIGRVGVLAAMLTLGGNIGVPAFAETAPSWPGVGAMTGGKGYAATPMGEVHYRDVGPRDAKATMLLLHQTPMSIMEFAAIQNALADLGIRSVAIDTPGYGMSDQPKGWPSIEEFADNLVPVLDALKIPKVIVGGHHTGAEIATSFATRHPDRVSGLVLHGLPALTHEEAAVYLSRPEWDRTPKPDGSHLNFLFKYPPTNGVAPTTGELMARTWMSVLMFLEGNDIGHPAAFKYDMTADLKTLKTPVLILSDAKDAIHYIDLRVAKMRPDFTYREFSQGNTGEIMIQPNHWADLAAEFIRTSVK
jgi:pimeloyl-ACP methyl ester carboxylesterase